MLTNQHLLKSRLVFLFGCVLALCLAIPLGSHAQENTSDTSGTISVEGVKSFFYFDGKKKQLTDALLLVQQSGSLHLSTRDRYILIEMQSDQTDSGWVYTIEHFDDRWSNLSSDPIRISGLPPGNYSLILARNGKEKGPVLRIGLILERPFFETIRSYAFSFIVALLLVILFLRARHLFIRRDKRRTVRMLENTVQRRTVQLQQSLSQRELLIKEIHHRVKNNLQVISALLEMQASRTEDEKVKAAILEGQNRVLSIAFIHQNLYQHDDLKGVEIGSFLNELLTHISQVFEKPDCPVNVESQVPKFYLDIDSAIPLGLIINELLTNSYKYAFTNRPQGEIRIELKPLEDGEFYFRYSDNGVGLPKNFDFMRSNSLGLKLVRQLSRQLAGNVHYVFDNGSIFEMNFKDLEARGRML